MPRGWLLLCVVCRPDGLKFALHVGFGIPFFCQNIKESLRSSSMLSDLLRPEGQACLLGLSRGNKPVRSEQPEGTNQIRQFPPDPPERTRQFLSEGKAFIPWTERSDSLLRPNRRDKPAVTRTFSFSTRDIFNLANGGDGIIFFQTFSSYNFGSATQVGVGRGSGGFAQSGPGETPSCARRPRKAVTRRRLFGGGPCIDCGDVSTRGT